MTIIEAIKIRSSCQTYSNKPILPHQFVALYNFLEANKEAPFGSKVRFQLLDLNELEIDELKNLGTYGVIKGARHFMVGAVVKAPGAMEDYGYCMEKNILEATALGLGTCLLGGTFKRSGFADKVNTTKDELLPVISPIGYSSGKRSIVDRTFRLIAGSNQRKPWHELFYFQDTDTPRSRSMKQKPSNTTYLLNVSGSPRQLPINSHGESLRTGNGITFTRK